MVLALSESLRLSVSFSRGLDLVTSLARIFVHSVRTSASSKATGDGPED